MTEEELMAYHEASFDVFCKKVIRNLAADAHRKHQRTARNQVTMEDSIINQIARVPAPDLDFYGTYCKTFRIRGIEVKVRDETIGECMQYIMPNKRAVLLLSFFMGMSDTEISHVLQVSCSTVGRRKSDAMKRLKGLLEARKYGQ